VREARFVNLLNSDDEAKKPESPQISKLLAAGAKQIVIDLVSLDIETEEIIPNLPPKHTQPTPTPAHAAFIHYNLDLDFDSD
jgi:hypothetical protein